MILVGIQCRVLLSSLDSLPASLRISWKPDEVLLRAGLYSRTLQQVYHAIKRH